MEITPYTLFVKASDPEKNPPPAYVVFPPR